MSCYICSKNTIMVVAQGLIDYGIDKDYRLVNYSAMASVLVNERYQELAQVLLEQNYASVNSRYNENTKAPKEKFERIDYNCGTLLGCIQNYNYQSCNTEDYNNSLICRALKALKNKMLERLIKYLGQEIPFGLD